MLLATAVWSLGAALTFALSRALGAYDYRAFFKGLLGPAWVLFEAAYIIFVILILAVFGAAAGAIGAATFGWPEPRSEEHTSELQSLMRISYAVFCLKTKKKQ